MRHESVRQALQEFVNVINGSGGVVLAGDGLFEPTAKCSWVDLGEAYRLARQALGVEPSIWADSDDDEKRKHLRRRNRNRSKREFARLAWGNRRG